MATFSKNQVIQCGSLSEFARWAECYKVYQLPNDNDFIAIRSPSDEAAMFNSRYCIGAKLVWERGKFIPFDSNDFFICGITFYGQTEDMALSEARKSDIPQEKIKSITIRKPVTQERSEGTGETEEKAIQNAKSLAYQSGFDFVTVSVAGGGESNIELECSSEDEAKEKWMLEVNGNKAGNILQKIVCMHPSQKYLFGFIKKKGLYKVYWYQPYKVVVSYKAPAQAQLLYSTYVSSDEKASVDKVSIKELVHLMKNGDAQEIIEAGRQLGQLNSFAEQNRC